MTVRHSNSYAHALAPPGRRVLALHHHFLPRRRHGHLSRSTRRRSMSAIRSSSRSRSRTAAWTIFNSLPVDGLQVVGSQSSTNIIFCQWDALPASIAQLSPSPYAPRHFTIPAFDIHTAGRRRAPRQGHEASGRGNGTAPATNNAPVGRTDACSHASMPPPIPPSIPTARSSCRRQCGPASDAARATILPTPPPRLPACHADRTAARPRSSSSSRPKPPTPMSASPSRCGSISTSAWMSTPSRIPCPTIKGSDFLMNDLSVRPRTTSSQLMLE